MYISNLDTDVNETELREVFEKFGPIKDVRIVRQPVTKESRGFGFVTFEKVEDAGEALGAMDKFDLRGKELRIERARRSKPHEATPGTYCGPAGASSKYRNSYRRRHSSSPSGRSRSRS